MPASDTTVDSSEIAKFAAMADAWWDPHGAFRPLHKMNPCRLDYICAQIAAEFDRDLAGDAPFAGLRLLDIGCGGGLLAEPMARLGASVLGADAAAENIEIARAHAAKSGLEIDYQHAAAEELRAADEAFDVVLASEIIEHVSDSRSFLASCRGLLNPAGLLIVSTLNRTPMARLKAIFGAEYVLRWLPRGTHDYSKFVTPEELFTGMAEVGLEPVDRKGMVYNPIRDEWSLSDRDVSINYIAAAVNPA